MNNKVPFLYRLILLQDWERQLFHLMVRNQHRESSKVKKRRDMFQTKEQDKKFTEMEISNLPEKIEEETHCPAVGMRNGQLTARHMLSRLGTN